MLLTGSLWVFLDYCDRPMQTILESIFVSSCISASSLCPDIGLVKRRQELHHLIMFHYVLLRTIDVIGIMRLEIDFQQCL